MTTLAPYTVVSLAKSDADGTDGSNIIAGAVVQLFDNGSPVSMADDSSGTNPNTTKLTDSNGQVIIWIEHGTYELQVNGTSSEFTLLAPIAITTTELIASTQVYDVGTHIVTTAYDDGLNGGGGDWVRTSATGTASQSPVDLANAQLTDATGAVWELSHSGTIQFSQLGAVAGVDAGSVFLAYAGSDANLLDLENKNWLATSLNMDNATNRESLNSKSYNGTLQVTNALGHTTDIWNRTPTAEDAQVLVETKSPVVDWVNKEVLWLGTSIPHQASGTDGYPERFGEILQCNVYNLAWSGSHAFYDINGDAFNGGTVRALSMTEADRLAGLALYGASSAYDDSFNTVTIASEMTCDYRIEAEFQNQAMDVVMLDHNHNDRKNDAGYVANDKNITSITIGTETVFAVDSVSGLAVGDGCYVEVEGIDDLNYMAGRISDITSLNVTVAFDSTGFTGSFTSGTFHWVDRNTIAGSFDFLIAYIKNCSIRYGDGDVKIVLCNAPSNYTNNNDPDFGIWHCGRAIAAVAANWGLSYFDVAHEMRITYHDHLTYLPDAVHPTTSAGRKIFANYWTQWAIGGRNETYNSELVLQLNTDIGDNNNYPAMYSKYDDKFAARNEIYNDGEIIIDDDFSSGIGDWTAPDTTPTVVSAPWDAGEDSVRFDATVANDNQRLSQTVTLGRRPSVSFDFYITESEIASGVSNQITIATINKSGISYQIGLVQTAGSDMRLSVNYYPSGPGIAPAAPLPFETYIIEPSTKYTFSYEIVDGYAYFSSNGEVLYAGAIDNSLLLGQTEVVIGTIFSNTSTDFNYWIGNYSAKNKSLIPIPSIVNANTFAGNDLEICQIGQAASGTDAWFFFDLKSDTDSTGVTLAGEFAVYRGASLLLDDVTVLHSNLGSSCKGMVTISGLTGLTTGETLILRFSEDNSSIRFDF